jgi:hypothetical protein
MKSSSLPSRHPRRFLAAAIILTSLTALLAFAAWGSLYEWHIPLDSLYVLFPLFGLLAFSIMWSQYMTEAAKNIFAPAPRLVDYYKYTSWIVLVLIVLHPGLLIAQRFRDGYGLPPGSYTSYVAPAQEWITLLGTASLLVFLAFTLKRWLGRYTWWRYILLLNDVAILAIFYHGLRLGQTLQAGWFQTLWWFYGLTLIAALGYKYYQKYRGRFAP